LEADWLVNCVKIALGDWAAIFILALLAVVSPNFVVFKAPTSAFIALLVLAYILTIFGVLQLKLRPVWRNSLDCFDVTSFR